MKDSSFRLFFLALFFVAIFLIGVDAYLQYVVPFIPSYLDHIERFAMLIVALVCFLGSLQFYSKIAVKIAQTLLLIISSALGMIIAARHIWLETHATSLTNISVQTLTPDMLHNLPFSALIRLIYTGTGTSTQILWSKFGITLTEWTFIAFAFFFIVAIIMWFKVFSVPKK